jgi:hypothetical protein
LRRAEAFIAAISGGELEGDTLCRREGEYLIEGFLLAVLAKVVLSR